VSVSSQCWTFPQSSSHCFPLCASFVRALPANLPSVTDQESRCRFGGHRCSASDTKQFSPVSTKSFFALEPAWVHIGPCFSHLSLLSSLPWLILVDVYARSKQGTQQNAPSSESRTLEEKRQTLKAKQAELAALENELLAQRSRTSAETPVSTARCEAATPGESVAGPLEMVQDTLVDSDAVRCPSLGASREEEMAAWRTASGSGIAAAAGRPSDVSTSGRPSDASIVGRPSDTGLKGPSNEASRLRARNKELEEVCPSAWCVQRRT
jgi:hypothetical protein